MSTARVFGVLFWFGLLLNFFGLLTPLIATTEAVLNTNLAIRSFNITLGDILVALIAVWASFLISKFVRFLLEEDIYRHLHLASGIPYAISTVLHYAILLFGLFRRLERARDRPDKAYNPDRGIHRGDRIRITKHNQ